VEAERDGYLHARTDNVNYARYSVLIPLCNFVKCQNGGLFGTGIRVPQSGIGMLRYRTEMLDAEIPMPAASASMPMPSYAGFQAERFVLGLEL
jgi:hypothetical protein